MATQRHDQGRAQHRSFVAIGDSFTEGLDDLTPDGRARGWADRVAEILAERRPGFGYANLAVRGKVLTRSSTSRSRSPRRCAPT